MTQAVAERVTSPYKITVDKGSTNHRVSSQWFSRPDDQRFLSLEELRAAVQVSADESRATLVDVKDVRVIAKPDDADKLELLLPEKYVDGVKEARVEPNHWSFGQLAQLLTVPAGYLRKLPAPIAGINLQYALSNFRSEVVKTYIRQNGKTELRAATGPDYGRIFDHEVVDAVMKVAGDGNWKVPGCIDWSTMMYDPFARITKQSTTLYASDRDVFVFLVDDTHPIEVGKLADGSPDLMFRGFMAWNSEVGSKTFGLAGMYLRGTCQNRCLWGVENFNEITIRHSKQAPSRFIEEARPALESFANGNTKALVDGVKAAKEAIVAKTDEDRREFLGKKGFSSTMVTQIINTVVEEEGKKPESIWDFVQGITAVARGKTHQDARVDLERTAGKLLDKVA